MIQINLVRYNHKKKIHFCKKKALSDAKKIKLGNKYDPINLLFKAYNYDVWFESEESPDTTKTDKKSTDFPPMQLLEGDEEVKEGNWFKILTSNKLLTRLSISLAKIKAGNNLYKLKNVIRQILNLLYQHNKITKKAGNNLIKLF